MEPLSSAFLRSELDRVEHDDWRPSEHFSSNPFTRTLAYALDQTHYVLPRSPRVLSLGTGTSGLEEYAACFDYARLRGRLPEYTAIDPSEGTLKFTRQQLDGFPNVHVLCGDARALPYLITGQFDLVIARHPECETDARHSDLWFDILSVAQRQMTPEARFVGTNFWRKGYLHLQSIALLNGFHVLLEGENPYPGTPLVSLDNELSVEDKYITVARR